jgi:hypothetical protein
MVIQFYARNSREAPVQTAAFVIVMVALFGLNLVDKERGKYKEPKLGLNHKEFLQNENHRIDQNIRLDRWAALLSCAAIAGVALYATQLLSAGGKLACIAGTGAALLLLLMYERRKISHLKQWRDSLAEELAGLLSD